MPWLTKQEIVEAFKQYGEVISETIKYVPLRINDDDDENYITTGQVLLYINKNHGIGLPDFITPKIRDDFHRWYVAPISVQCFNCGEMGHWLRYCGQERNEKNIEERRLKVQTLNKKAETIVENCNEGQSKDQSDSTLDQAGKSQSNTKKIDDNFKEVNGAVNDGEQKMSRNDLSCVGAEQGNDEIEEKKNGEMDHIAQRILYEDLDQAHDNIDEQPGDDDESSQMENDQDGSSNFDDDELENSHEDDDQNMDYEGDGSDGDKDQVVKSCKNIEHQLKRQINHSKQVEHLVHDCSKSSEESSGRAGKRSSRRKRRKIVKDREQNKKGGVNGEREDENHQSDGQMYVDDDLDKQKLSSDETDLEENLQNRVVSNIINDIETNNEQFIEENNVKSSQQSNNQMEENPEYDELRRILRSAVKNRGQRRKLYEVNVWESYSLERTENLKMRYAQELLRDDLEKEVDFLIDRIKKHKTPFNSNQELRKAFLTFGEKEKNEEEQNKRRFKKLIEKELKKIDEPYDRLIPVCDSNITQLLKVVDQARNSLLTKSEISTDYIDTIQIKKSIQLLRQNVQFFIDNNRIRSVYYFVVLVAKMKNELIDNEVEKEIVAQIRNHYEFAVIN